MDKGICRACKQPILWVEMASGKKMPLDAKEVNVIQVKLGIGEVVQVYMPHWATCPGAEQFRKAKP